MSKVSSVAEVIFDGNNATIAYGGMYYYITIDSFGKDANYHTWIMFSEWDGDNLVSDAEFLTFGSAYRYMLIKLYANDGELSLDDAEKLCRWAATIESV